MNSCENSVELDISVDGNMVPKTLLQTRSYVPAGALLARFEGLLHPVTAQVEQMRGLVRGGQAPTSGRQSRTLDTLATTDGGQMAARSFAEMPRPKK